MKYFTKERAGFLFSEKQRHYIWLTVSAILFTFGMQAFVTVAETFASGLGAIASLLTYILPSLTAYFSLIYLAINIPGMIFSYKYNRKKFTARTLYFLFIQTLVGIPFMWDMQEVMAEHLWNFQPKDGFTSIELLRQDPWSLIILPTIGAILVGVATGFAWKAGGSTAGIDVITFYLSTKKKMSIGKVSKSIGFVIVVFSFTMKIIFVDGSRVTAFPTLVGTMLFIYFNTLMIDRIFPKYSKVEFQIFTDKLADVKKALKEDTKFRHAFNIVNITTGQGTKKYLITTTSLLLEVNHLKKVVITADETAWIKTTAVDKVFGIFNTEVID